MGGLDAVEVGRWDVAIRWSPHHDVLVQNGHFVSEGIPFSRRVVAYQIPQSGIGVTWQEAIVDSFGLAILCYHSTGWLEVEG